MPAAPSSPTVDRADVPAADGIVVVLSLNDPARKNAMTEALGDAFVERIAEVRGDERVRAVVLTGAGTAFSAGGDLQMLERLTRVSAAEARAHMRAFYARYLCLLDVPVPVIAAVHGPAIGAGLCVATACDLMVVAENATLAFNFAQLGLYPGMGGSYLLPRRVGAQHAGDLLLTGRRFDGCEAARIGLARTAVAGNADDVRSAALALAAEIASAGPMTVRALCADLRPGRADLESALEREAERQGASYQSAEFQQRLAALIKRTRP